MPAGAAEGAVALFSRVGRNAPTALPPGIAGLFAGHSRAAGARHSIPTARTAITAAAMIIHILRAGVLLDCCGRFRSRRLPIVSDGRHNAYQPLVRVQPVASLQSDSPLTGVGW